MTDHTTDETARTPQQEAIDNLWIGFQADLVGLIGHYRRALFDLGVMESESLSYAVQQALQLLSLSRHRADVRSGIIPHPGADTHVMARPHDMVVLGIVCALSAANRMAWRENKPPLVEDPMPASIEAMRAVFASIGYAQPEPAWIGLTATYATMSEDARAFMDSGATKGSA